MSEYYLYEKTGRWISARSRVFPSAHEGAERWRSRKMKASSRRDPLLLPLTYGNRAEAPEATIPTDHLRRGRVSLVTKDLYLSAKIGRQILAGLKAPILELKMVEGILPETNYINHMVLPRILSYNHALGQNRRESTLTTRSFWWCTSGTTVHVNSRKSTYLGALPILFCQCFLLQPLETPLSEYTRFRWLYYRCRFSPTSLWFFWNRSAYVRTQPIDW